MTILEILAFELEMELMENEFPISPGATNSAKGGIERLVMQAIQAGRKIRGVELNAFARQRGLSSKDALVFASNFMRQIAPKYPQYFSQYFPMFLSAAKSPTVQVDLPALLMRSESVEKWADMLLENPKTVGTVGDKHQLRICIDNVKNPLKAKFLGGPSTEEAEKLLKEKFGWSEQRIAKLKE